MRRRLVDYREIVGELIISNIYRKARRLYGKHILHINSTYQGGGVAEMLQTLVPLMNDIGIDTGWRILHGNPDFFRAFERQPISARQPVDRSRHPAKRLLACLFLSLSIGPFSQFHCLFQALVDIRRHRLYQLLIIQTPPPQE